MGIHRLPFLIPTRRCPRLSLGSHGCVRCCSVMLRRVNTPTTHERSSARVVHSRHHLYPFAILAPYPLAFVRNIKRSDRPRTSTDLLASSLPNLLYINPNAIRLPQLITITLHKTIRRATFFPNGQNGCVVPNGSAKRRAQTVRLNASLMTCA